MIASIFDWLSEDPVRWSWVIAAIAVILVLLTFPLAFLGGRRIRVPLWLPVAIVVVTFAGVAVGAWVYITTPVEVKRSPYEPGQEAMIAQGAPAEATGQADAAAGGMGMMGMGMPSPGGGPEGYPGMDRRPEGAQMGPPTGRRVARFQLIGTLRALQRVLPEGAFPMEPEQAKKVLALLEPLAGADSIDDQKAEQLLQALRDVLTDHQRDIIRQIMEEARRRARQRKKRRERPDIGKLVQSLLPHLRDRAAGKTPEGQGGFPVPDEGDAPPAAKSQGSNEH